MSFLDSTRPLLQQPNHHPAFIINMDQTPFSILDTPKKTLNQKGKRTVNAKTPKLSLGRITCLLTVCADGTKLPPLLCFRGRPCGPIEKKELPNASFNYPKSVKYTVQMNAWTDERVMLYWVDHVLTPYVKKAPPGIIPYVMLDKYSCHHQGTVEQPIESLEVEWDIIPGGYTALVQPSELASPSKIA